MPSLLKSIRNSLILALAGLAATAPLAAPAVGAEPAQSKSLKACLNKSDDIPSDQACYFAELHRVEAEMDAVYKQLFNKTEVATPYGRPRDILKSAQAAWRTYRDAECAFEAPDYGAALGRSEVAECQIAMTLARSKVLRENLP